MTLINNNIWNISIVLEELFHEILFENIIDKFYSDNKWFYEIESCYTVTPSNLRIYYDIKHFYMESLKTKIYGVETNILKYYHKDYNLDMKITELYDFFKNLKEIASKSNIDYYLDDICEYFEKNISETANISDIPKNIETKIINQYAIEYIHSNWKQNPKIFKLYKNILIYNSHKKKHSKLIALYNKLNIKIKQKKTIFRILNTTFDTDIIDTILYQY